MTLELSGKDRRFLRALGHDLDAVVQALLAGGFTGPVYPVNPSAAVVQSVAAYPSVADVPGPVDLAVIAVPAEAVITSATECADAGVRALVVLSAGFAETDDAGLARAPLPADKVLTVARVEGPAFHRTELERLQRMIEVLARLQESVFTQSLTG